MQQSVIVFFGRFSVDPSYDSYYEIIQLIIIGSMTTTTTITKIALVQLNK